MLSTTLRKQRGFGLVVYAILALAIIGSLSGLAWKLDHNGFVRGKAEIQQAWDAANEAARIAADAENEKRRIEKEKADAQNAKARRDLDGLYSAYRSLRDSRARSVLPEAAPGAANPATASFDRSGLDNALSSFDRGVTGLLEEGDRAIVDLNTAREWAQRR